MDGAGEETVAQGISKGLLEGEGWDLVAEEEGRAEGGGERVAEGRLGGRKGEVK